MKRYGKGNGWKNNVLNHAMAPIENFQDILARHRRWRKHPKRVWWILRDHRKYSTKFMKMPETKLHKQLAFGVAPFAAQLVTTRDYLIQGAIA